MPLSRALLRGGMLAWGRRPWLGLRFKSLFFNPRRLSQSRRLAFTVGTDIELWMRRAIPFNVSPIRTIYADKGFQGFWRPPARRGTVYKVAAYPSSRSRL
jgi:hypothetical protein